MGHTAWVTKVWTSKVKVEYLSKRAPVRLGYIHVILSSWSNCSKFFLFYHCAALTNFLIWPLSCCYDFFYFNTVPLLLIVNVLIIITVSLSFSLMLAPSGRPSEKSPFLLSIPSPAYSPKLLIQIALDAIDFGFLACGTPHWSTSEFNIWIQHLNLTCQDSLENMVKPLGSKVAQKLDTLKKSSGNQSAEHAKIIPKNCALCCVLNISGWFVCLLYYISCFLLDPRSYTRESKDWFD